MADFMDEEAVVSSEEEDMSDDENRTKTKSPSSNKKRQSKMISSDEEEEDDDEEKAKEEMKGFIAVCSLESPFCMIKILYQIIAIFECFDLNTIHPCLFRMTTKNLEVVQAHVLGLIQDRNPVQILEKNIKRRNGINVVMMRK